MELDELPAERQAEARSFSLLVRFAHLAKLFEHHVVILGRDPDARVSHRDLRRPVDDTGAHLDAPTLRGELHGVRQQVQ